MDKSPLGLVHSLASNAVRRIMVVKCRIYDIALSKIIDPWCILYTMAGANLPAKKYKKTAPTQIRLSFEGSGNGTQFIDLALALSAVNRKFYRQGVYYYVNSVELYNNEDAFVDLHTLPDTWVTKNAHQRAFQIFQKMNAMMYEAGINIKPKYHDFKVFMSDLHRTTGSLRPSLHGINSNAAAISSDDWEYSQFVSADDDQDSTANADEFFAHMLGDHSGPSDNHESIGLIKSYSETRATVPTEQPNDDNIATVQSDPLINIFDFSSEEQINDLVLNMAVDNDNPPYNIDFYNGESPNHMHHVARLATSATSGRVAKASGFCVPFGLMCIDPQATATSYRLVVNLAPGTYHGVYAERA